MEGKVDKSDWCHYLGDYCPVKRECVFIDRCPHKKARDIYNKVHEEKEEEEI